MGTIKGQIKYENNYKLQEDEDKMFKPQVVYEATQQVLEDILDTCTYVGRIDSKSLSILCIQINMIEKLLMFLTCSFSIHNFL